MFILYALVVGLAAGFLLGGRPAGLARLELRWAPLILGGLVVQLVLFSDVVASRIGVLGPSIYVVSSLAVLVAVLRNVALRGLPIVAFGAACNQVAIIANGGFMPAGADALVAQSRSESGLYSNSAAISNPAFAFLTDIFAMPSWVPFANIFSVGDVLIGIGVAVLIVAAMRSPEPLEPPDGASGNLPHGEAADSTNGGMGRLTRPT